jgi:preprotein translocase subunit SecA
VKTSEKKGSRAASRPGWKDFVGQLQGSTVRFGMDAFAQELTAIADLEPAMTALSDADLRARAGELRRRAHAGVPRSTLRQALYALAREAARRTLGHRPFDEQVGGALALDDGAVVEMQTGEGKTLAAVMPAALNALTGQGVHVLTFNDYLAGRDAEWMAPIYGMLGLTVRSVREGMPANERRQAYCADVTYVTAKEAGFDHLRDLLATDMADLTHRPFHFAIVDEADSLMLDEARVPLVIAGQIERDATLGPRLASFVASLSPGVHFDTDEYCRDVELTEAGIEQAERALGCGSLHRPASLPLLTELNCALHARVLLRRDIDYIVRDGIIGIVDPLTGRVVAGRHWPDGLQAALEAKEGLKVRAAGRVLGTMTLQAFLRGYARLSGMTGTARSGAAEFQQFYGLDVVVIPTHLAGARRDQDDEVFTHREARDAAVVAEIAQAYATGRPVLVGTASITDSERLAARLESGQVPCVVLNAKHDAEENAIVARAGALGAVTIATNMAGRGTDIRLGAGSDEDRERVAALGGLYVIGTSRHESLRIDMQLRGRAGRQGDPGETRFFVSLDDDLLVRYGLDNLIPAGRRPEPSAHPIDSAIVRREIARAQRIVEGQSFEIRRTLARYSAVLEQQHRLILARRMDVLTREEAGDVWARDPDRRAALADGAGEAAVLEAERLVTLHCIDRAWQDHLAFCADLREGIHLVRLGGRDPLTEYTSGAIRAFERIMEEIDSAILAALAEVRVTNGELDLSTAGVLRPGATWTYLVNDDPFRDRLGATLTGQGGATVATYAAAMLMPLLILWGLVENLVRRKPRRRSDRLTPP